MFRNLVRLVVLALVVHAGVRIVPEFWHYLQFKDAVTEVASYPGRKTPEQLRKQVTSPNGTTERAIARMGQTDLEAMFIEATEAALARSRELAEGKA